MNTKCVKNIFVGCAFLASSIAFFSVEASNVGFLRDSFLTELNKADAESLKNAAKSTFDQGSDKQTVYWEGESGLKGKIEPQLSYQLDGKECRRVRFAAKKQNNKVEQYKFDVCKYGEQWKVESTPVSSFTKKDWQTLSEELFYALDNAVNQHPVSWVQQETGMSGVIVPLSSFEEKGKACRKTTISVIDRKGRTSDGVYTFCKNDKSEWLRKY